MQSKVEKFYGFMKEREAIRQNRLAGRPWPWTKDTILQTYKFTNVKREHDWTSVQLRKYFYTPNRNAALHQILYNCAVARYFGTYEFIQAVGWQGGFNPDYLISIARERMNRKERVFTGAYVITNQGIKAPKEEVVVNIFLKGLWDWCVSHDLSHIVMQEESWEKLITTLRTIPGFGGTGFMAKEVVLDTLFTDFWPHKQPKDFNIWCPAGPGARRGINRMLDLPLDKPMAEVQLLSHMKILFGAREMHWPKHYPELCLHDVQFQLCEFDKYERVRLDQGRPRSKYQPRKGAKECTHKPRPTVSKSN